MDTICCPQVVGIETEKVSKEKVVADEEEHKVAAIAVVVSGKQRDCQEDLAKAEPALLAAQEALNTLNKVHFLLNALLSHNDLFCHTNISSCSFFLLFVSFFGFCFTA